MQRNDKNMKNFNIKNLKYRYRFFFTLDYLLKKIGINFTKAYIYSIKLDNIDFKEPKTDNVVIKECEIDDLPKFGELEDLFLSDLQNERILIAAFLNDEWIGYNWISLKPMEVEEVERVIHFDGAYMYRAHVKEEYRKMGIMKKIVFLSLNQIKNKYKKDEVYAITETTNIPAKKTLESYGFSKVGLIKFSKFFLWKKYEEKINNNTVTLVTI